VEYKATVIINYGYIHYSDMHAMLTKQQMLIMQAKNVELKTELEGWN